MKISEKILHTCEVLKNLHDANESNTLFASSIKYAAWGLIFIEMNGYEDEFDDFASTANCELTDSQINHLKSLGIYCEKGQSESERTIRKRIRVGPQNRENQKRESEGKSETANQKPIRKAVRVKPENSK